MLLSKLDKKSVFKFSDPAAAARWPGFWHKPHSQMAIVEVEDHGHDGFKVASSPAMHNTMSQDPTVEVVGQLK